ncbi:Uma2 family endonuclease [Dyadobacter arcticus]|uniref:Uma2 family endonuclease n=1 Tax=Dyadobacter arcticus TaxID=1078754 RepID=A0ABX0UD89_9BACT|nr:Uma2 family endonuclease [Dyadobacter arcticus]NIJ50974.1 Uma2 family endonuclease [Dyadobacter arcticus]
MIIEAVKAALDKEKETRLKFYDNITEEDKAEFINGEVIMHSPVMMRHNHVTGLLLRLLGIYVAREQLGFVGFEKLMISLTRNDYEPDICFFRQEKSAQFTGDQILFPAPDLIIEILSNSTQARDRGVKLKDYQAHRIEEYWIIDPKDETLEQYHLFGEEYQLVLKSRVGDVKSFVVEGFLIPIRAIFDNAENLKALQNL